MCQNAKKISFGTKKKVKLKDSEYKNSSLVSQIDCKNTKDKSKSLVKCFVNSFTKNPPISARNVPKLPAMSPVLQIDCKKRKKQIKLLLK